MKHQIGIVLGLSMIAMAGAVVFSVTDNLGLFRGDMCPFGQVCEAIFASASVPSGIIGGECKDVSDVVVINDYIFGPKDFPCSPNEQEWSVKAKAIKFWGNLLDAYCDNIPAAAFPKCRSYATTGLICEPVEYSGMFIGEKMKCTQKPDTEGMCTCEMKEFSCELKTYCEEAKTPGFTAAP